MNTDFTLKANGKLLISGEYLVLNGAKAVAFPIRYGQEIKVTPLDESILSWKSMQNGKSWFTASFNLPDLNILTASDTEIASELIKLLKAARSLNPEFMSDNGFSVAINANYPLEWGLGSSSTLIYLIAHWAKINEFSLFRLIADGSAYDLACAAQQTPIYYQLIDKSSIITPVEVGNGLKNYCLFAYLGNKQNTQEEIKRYKNKITPTQQQIERISELSVAFCKASDANQLIEIMKEHEQILSSILKKPALALQSFPDFQGAVKSLGAWGGDFAMFAADKSLEDIRLDLNHRGITTVFSFEELLIK